MVCSRAEQTPPFGLPDARIPNRLNRPRAHHPRPNIAGRGPGQGSEGCAAALRLRHQQCGSVSRLPASFSRAPGPALAQWPIDNIAGHCPGQGCAVAARYGQRLRGSVSSRQWPEVPDFVARFCTLRESNNTRPCENRTRNAYDSRMAVCYLTRARAKKCDTNHIPRATA